MRTRPLAIVDDPSLLTVAEDSGPVVDALDGEPGVRSARFLRPDASYHERFDEIYRVWSRGPAGRARRGSLRAGGRARNGRGLRNHRDGRGRDRRRAPRQRRFRIRPDLLLPALRPTLAEVDDEEKLAGGAPRACVPESGGLAGHRSGIRENGRNRLENVVLRSITQSLGRERNTSPLGFVGQDVAARRSYGS